ncbi:MAG: hypothetical protein P8N09_00350 [Planctomycetota bacterium]|jgi:hypothetical protein|nr:hypothetical protein [Planctomycetota bacterium]
MPRIANLLIVVALFASLGCSAKSTEVIKTEAPDFVNANCPIMGSEVEPDGGQTSWNGKEVGFCCGKCVGKFDAMDDSQKQSAIDKHNP